MGLAPAPHKGGSNHAAVNEAEARKQRVLARIAAMDSTTPPPMDSATPPPHGSPAAEAASHGAVAAPIEEETYIGMAAPLEEETYFGPSAVGQAEQPGGRTEIYMGAGTPRAGSASAYASSSSPSSEATVAVAPRYNQSPHVADAEVEEAAPNTARMRASAPAPQQPPPYTPSRPPPGVWESHRRQSQAPPHPQVSVVTPQDALAVRPWTPTSSIHGPQQLGHQALHALSGPLDKRLVLLNEPHSTRAASFRVLRDNLLTKSMPRVVAVTSATPNDGKTTCSANLALALSELPHTRVLVLDANFFSLDLSKAFTVDRLSSISPPEAAIWLAPYKVVEVTASLHVAGVPPIAGPVRFEQQRFEALIDHLLRVNYDFIVIDTPALRGTPSVTQLLSNADGALLVVRSGGTTTRDLRKAAEQLPPNKALGLALMDVLL